MEAQDRVVLGKRLAAMEADRHVEISRCGRRAAEEFGRAGLDPVGRKHGADQPPGAALEVAAEAFGLGQTVQAALLVEVKVQRAGVAHEGVARSVCGTEINPQAELLSRFGRGGELVAGLAPFAVEERGDRQCRGDAVPDQPGEGIALLPG